jgi:Fic family protein
MKIEAFKAGVWKSQYQYKSFSPTSINHEWNWDDPRINVLLEQATKALGELNAFSLIVPDVDMFIQMHIVKEANTSSRIEGTQTDIDEALMPEDAINPEKRDDWREVRNYIEAINVAVQELERLPVSNRLLCQTHGILMDGVRGMGKQPGELRTAQNWIGGSGPMDAAFVPPHPHEVQELMSDLERFLHNDNIFIPHLIRVAIAHYQFETIHPFNDGNGRIGRLLITLYLVSEGVLEKPSLYLSDFFERNRSSYYDGLMRVRTADDLGAWVRFFLSGVLETATKGRETFQKILILRNEVEESCLSLGRKAPLARKALTLLYRKPMVTAKEIESFLETSTPTANALIKDLQRIGILTELTGRDRWRLYVFNRYINLF